MSGYQLSGDAPTTYTRFGYKIMEPWTDDLIRSARCRDGDRVLDVACGPGLVANRVNQVSRKLCMVTGIDLNEGMLNIARRNPAIEWHQGSATELPFGRWEFRCGAMPAGIAVFSGQGRGGEGNGQGSFVSSLSSASGSWSRGSSSSPRRCRGAAVPS